MKSEFVAIASSLRMQAWERAKGELRAALCASADDEDRYKKYSEAKKLVDKFIKDVEDWELMS
jgi:hypothetical protein